VRVGFYSPLPPAPTGVADYAAALLDELRHHGSVEVAPSRCDAALYHLGNNRRALEQPGVAVLHDAVLHHFFLGASSERDYIEEFVYNYGEWSHGLARNLWRARAASGSDPRYFEYPLLKRIAERSRAVVVHNPGAAAVVERHAPGARVVEIPHLFQAPPPVSAGETLRYRQRLGVPADAFLFGLLGYLRESKRVAAVLEVFRQVRREVPRAALLVAGRFVSSDLERAVAPQLREPGVVRLPFLPEGEFRRAAHALDACVNLRWPATGETSGIAIRLMGIGKPVLVTDSPECARFPEDACLRVESGVAERESLHEQMILLTSISGVASAIGARGAGHIRAHHRVEEAAKLYWGLLCECCT